MQAIEFEMKRAEVREAERVDREAELTAELDAAKVQYCAIFVVVWVLCIVLVLCVVSMRNLLFAFVVACNEDSMQNNCTFVLSVFVFILELRYISAQQVDIGTYPAVLEKVRRKREKEGAKHAALIRKQDKLLFVGFYILLNLAEDLSVEKKMVKKQLIPSLATTLGM